MTTILIIDAEQPTLPMLALYLEASAFFKKPMDTPIRKIEQRVMNTLGEVNPL
jgi:hypothetical protein